MDSWISPLHRNIINQKSADAVDSRLAQQFEIWGELFVVVFFFSSGFSKFRITETGIDILTDRFRFIKSQKHQIL